MQRCGPVRTCVGCRRRDVAGNLVRVARAGDGSLFVSRDAPGRGAWLCRDPATGFASTDCVAVASRTSGFSRAFRAAVTTGQVTPLGASTSERANIEADAEAAPPTDRRD